MISLAIVSQLGILFGLIFLASIGIPGSLLWMISAGAIAANMQELSIVIIVIAIAAILGDIIAYEIARRFSDPISKRLKRYKYYNDNEAKIKDSLNRSEFSLVFLTRFAFTSFCATVSYISGFEKLDRKKFIIAVISGELLYAIIYPSLGYFFKETWLEIYTVIGNIAVIAMLMVLGIVLIIIWRSIMKNYRS